MCDRRALGWGFSPACLWTTRLAIRGPARPTPRSTPRPSIEANYLVSTPATAAPAPARRRASARELKIIDLSNFESRKQAIAKELTETAENLGFFYVSGHGIPQELIDEAFAADKRFLTAPQEVKEKKQKLQRDTGVTESQAYILGYSRERNSAATLRESFLCSYDNLLMQGRWPDEEDAPGFRDTLLKFMWANHHVVEMIMRGFAIGLGLPEDFFTREMDPRDPENATTMNNNYYPSLEGVELPADTLRIYAHCDYECLSLLHVREGEVGLEVLPGRETDASTALEKDWTDMDPIRGAITVNMGDCLQYWTDGRLKANFHRVRYPRPGEYRGERQSIAYFSNARLSTAFQGPLKRYPPITFSQVMESKKQKDLPVKVEKLDPEEYVRWQSQFYVMGPEIPPVGDI